MTPVESPTDDVLGHSCLKLLITFCPVYDLLTVTLLSYKSFDVRSWDPFVDLLNDHVSFQPPLLVPVVH